MNAEYYSSLLVKLKDILKEKLHGKSHKLSCFCTTMPRLTGHLQPRRNWHTWDSSLFSRPRYSPDLAPSDITPVLWTKKQLKFRHFPSDAEVVAIVENWWTDNFLNLFFW